MRALVRLSISLCPATRGLPVAGFALWEAPFAPPDSGGREWADEVNRRIDTGDLAGALRHYMRDMLPAILDIVPNTPRMVDQAGSLKVDGHSLAWAESAPHAELFGGLRVPNLALIGTETYDVMRPSATRSDTTRPTAVPFPDRPANVSRQRPLAGPWPGSGRGDQWASAPGLSVSRLRDRSISRSASVRPVQVAPSTLLPGSSSL